MIYRVISYVEITTIREESFYIANHSNRGLLYAKCSGDALFILHFKFKVTNGVEVRVPVEVVVALYCKDG